MSEEKEVKEEQAPVEEVVEEVVEATEATETAVEATAETTEEPEAKEEKETSEEQKEEEENEDIFITEDDTFDVKVRWYKIEEKLFVEDGDTEFDEAQDVNEFAVTFKLPSQGDYEVIINSSVYRSPDEMKISDIVQLELARMVTLVRSWSLEQDISRMVQLDPDIIKAILKGIRDEVGMKAIL